jgi:hypothetical protein
MKKLIATALAVVGLSACANAQGTFILDSSANNGDNATPTSTSGGLVFLSGVLDTATDINLALLWNTSSSSVLATPNSLNIDPGGSAGYWSLTQSDQAGVGDITGYANGSIGDPNGNTYAISGEAIGATVWVVLEAWTGSAISYATAQTTQGAYFGSTTPFQITLASSTAIPPTDLTPMGSLNLVSVPEPTSLALAGLGGFGMLMALRRKQA